MAWTPIAPDGSKSVKQNEAPMLENTEYTKTTMNVDHFWDESVNEDGHHTRVQMTKKDNDDVLGTGMDGSMYLKNANGTAQGFYIRRDRDKKNLLNVYQFIPQFLTGYVYIPDEGYITVVNVPNESYGEITMFRDSSFSDLAVGFFKATQGVCQAYAMPMVFKSNKPGNTGLNLQFLNGTTKDKLEFKAKRVSSPQEKKIKYEYRIKVWAM